MRRQSPFAGNTARRRPSTALPNATWWSDNAKTCCQNANPGLNVRIASKSARARASTGLSSVSVPAGCVGASDGTARRDTAFHVAAGIAAASTATAMITTRIGRVGIMCMGIGSQARSPKLRDQGHALTFCKR